mgnify:CR=1 FL=1
MLQRPKEVQFEFPQPPAPYPPSQRSGALIGPSGVGKTTTAIAMLMGPYRGVYSRVYVFSPSCAPGVDPAWDAWRKHVSALSTRSSGRSHHCGSPPLPVRTPGPPALLEQLQPVSFRFRSEGLDAPEHAG